MKKQLQPQVALVPVPQNAVCRTPRKSLRDIILPSSVGQSVCELVNEHKHRDILAAHALRPTNRILLTGPSGNGKTTLAEVLAHELGLPFIVASHSGMIRSYLGDTGRNIHALLTYTEPCLMFFDEFESVSSERSGTDEVGEIKRVVASMLLDIDSIPPTMVFVAATNHPELLDRAARRRFDEVINLDNPDLEGILNMFALLRLRHNIDGVWSDTPLSRHLFGNSFAGVERHCLDLIKRHLIGERHE